MKAPRTLVVLLAGGTVLVSLTLVASFWSFGQVQAATRERQRTSSVLARANQVMAALVDAETGHRGYLLTGEEAYLEPYVAGRNQLEAALPALGSFNSLPEEERSLKTLQPLVGLKLGMLAKGVALRRAGDQAGALANLRGPEGKPLMDTIRAELGRFTGLIEAGQAQRDAAFEASLRRLFMLIVGASAFMLLLVVLFGWLVHRETQQRIRNGVHAETRRLLEVQEQLNATLSISEARLAVTLNSIGDAVIATDAAGRVSLMNPLAETLTGWPRGEALGKPIVEVVTIIGQESRLPATVPVAQTLEHGTSHGLANHTVLVARDGTERSIADSCAPIRDRDNQVVGAVLVFRDVTEDYEVQQALRAQQFYTRSLIESNVDALVTTDPAGLITDANRQTVVLTGRSREALIGAPFEALFTDPARARAAIEQAVREQSLTDCELAVRASDGTETAVSYSASAIYNQHGKLQGVFAAARDVTERKRLDRLLLEKNAELENARAVADKANRAKSEFLSSMSHELRSPLNAILGFAQLIETEVPPPAPSLLENVAQILKGGWHLLALINEILDLARVESGQVPLSQEPVSVADVLLECQAMMGPQALQRGLELSFTPPSGAWFVSADRTRLKQVLINLLSNAIKYNTKNGTVVVGCEERTAGRLRLSVTDTGPGLSPEQVGQLFQAFNRLGQEAGGEEGTGIGLVVAKRLVELMGGEVGVDSAVGRGSVFWFELAVAVAPQLLEESGEPATSATPRTMRSALTPTVLYVEDNPANLLLVRQIIARFPSLQLLSAVDGYGGIELARSARPDVILMDINLPGINGLEAMRILHADAKTAHIPVLALSANAMPRDVARGLEAGFFRYITKPIKVDEFVATLNAALEFAGQTRAGRG